MALREKQTSTLNQDILSVQEKVTADKSNEHILIVFNQDQMNQAEASIPPRNIKSEMNSKLVSTYNVTNGTIKSQMPGNKRRDVLGQSQFEKTQTKDQLISDEVSYSGDRSRKSSFKLQSDANRGTRMNLNQTMKNTQGPTMIPQTTKDGQFVRMDTVFDVLVATDEQGGKSNQATLKGRVDHEEPAVVSNRKARKCDTLSLHGANQELKAMLNNQNKSPVELNVASVNYSYVQTPTNAAVNLNKTIDPKTLFNKVDKLKQGTQFKINQARRSTKNKSVAFDPQDKQDIEAKTLFLHNKTRLQTLKLNVLKDVEKFSSINPVNTSAFENQQTRNCKTSQSYNRPRFMPMKIKHLNPLQVPVPLRYGNLGRIGEDAKKHIMIQELASKRFSGLSGALSTDRNKANSRQQQRTKSQQLGFNTTNEVETKSRSKQSVHVLGNLPVNTPPMDDADKQPQSISEEPNSAMVLSDMQQASPRFYEGDQNKMSQIVSMDQAVPTEHNQAYMNHLPAQDYIDKSYPSASSSFQNTDPNGIHRFRKIRNFASPPLQRPQARNCQTSQNPRIKNINLHGVGNGLVNPGVNAREINLFQKNPKNVDGFDAPIVHQQNQRYKQLRKINNKDLIDDQESSHMGSYIATSPMQMNSTLNENENSAGRQRKDTSLQKRRREYLRNQEVMIIDFILKQYLRYRQKQSEYKNFKNSLEDNNENQMQNMTQNFEYTYMMAYMKQRNIYSFSYFRKYNLDKFSMNPIAHRIAKQVLSSLDPYRQMDHVKIDDFIALRKKLIEKSIIKKIELPQQLESMRNNAFSQKDDIESELVRGGETGSNTIRNFGSSQSPKTRNPLAVLSAHHITNGRVSVISDRSRASGTHTPDNLMVTFSETQDARQNGANYNEYNSNQVPSPNAQLRLVNKKSTLATHGNVHVQRDQSPKVKIVHRAAIFENSVDVLNSNSFKPDMKQKKKLSMSITDTTEHQVGFKSILPDNLDYGIQDFEQYVALIIQSQSISEQIDKKATNISRSRKHRFGSDFRLDMTSLIDRKIFNSLKPQIHIPNLDLNKQIGRRVRIEKIEMQIKKLQLIKEPTAQNKQEIETLKSFLRTTAPDSRLLRSIEQPLRSNRPNQTTYRQSTLERDSHDFSIQERERGSNLNVYRDSQYEYSIYDVSQIRASEESEKLEVKAVGLNINKHKNHNALKLRMLQQENNARVRSNSQLDIPVGDGLGEAVQPPQDFTNAYEQQSYIPQNIMNLESIGREDKELSNTLYRTTPKSGHTTQQNKNKRNIARLHAININQIQAAPSENFQRIDLETVRIRQRTQQMSNKSSASVPISHSSHKNQPSTEPNYAALNQDVTPGITPSVKQVHRYQSTLKKRDESQGNIHSISEKGQDNRSDMSIKSSKYQNGKRSILIKSSVDQNLQGNFEQEQANSRDDATGDELDQENDNRMDSQMDTNQDAQTSLDNQNTHTLETIMNKKQVEELMKKVSQGSSIQDIFPNGSIMYGENEAYNNDRQISIEDDALDLRTDLKLGLHVTMDRVGQDDYNENVDLLSSAKKTRGNTRAGVRTSTKASIKLPARRVVDSRDDGTPHGAQLHLLEQLSSCYGVMSPQAKKTSIQQNAAGARRLQSRQKKARGKNEDLDQILRPISREKGRNSITISKEGSRGEHLTTQQSKSRNDRQASKTITPMMSHKYHIAPQYKTDKKTTLTPVVANQAIKQGQIKHDYFKFKTLQQRATKPQKSSNRKEREKENKKKVEPLITSARHGRENSKNTARDQRSKSNTVTPRTTREQRENTTSNSHTKTQGNAYQLGLKSHEVSIQNKFMNDLRESIMYMQNMQITGNQLTSNHLESLNISMQENAMSLHNSTVEQQEQLRKLQNQTVPIPSRSNSPMSQEQHDQLEMENRMMLTHHLEEFNLLQMQQLQSPPASFIPPERPQYNLAQIGQLARNYQTPAYRNQVLQQGQIQSMIYKNRNNLCLQK